LEYIQGVDIYPVSHFQDVVQYVVAGDELPIMHVRELQIDSILDDTMKTMFASVQGHVYAKRVMAIGVA
jgi:predicted ATPase with chaperone activity